MQGGRLDEAYSALSFLRVSLSDEDGHMAVAVTAGVSLPPQDEANRMWETAARNLVYRACNSGRLDWLCEPRRGGGYVDAHFDAVVTSVLEDLARTTAVRRPGGGGAAAAGGAGDICYYECLVAHLLATHRLRDAARVQRQFAERLAVSIARGGTEASRCRLGALW